METANVQYPTSNIEGYEAFLRSKVKMAERSGFDVELGEINARLKPHQRAAVRWLVNGGRRALFMLLPPQSWNADVWTDVTRMRTLNAVQVQKGQQVHLCPLQFDIADRVITQCSMAGEVVWDPFMGIGTVPLRALKAGRRGAGCELSGGYFADAWAYCEAQEQESAAPGLFDFITAGALGEGSNGTAGAVVSVQARENSKESLLTH